MKRMIGITGLALLFWHQAVGATLVSMDFTFQNYNFAVVGGTGSGDVVFRVSYNSDAPDGNSDTNVGSYDGTEALTTDGKTSPTVAATIEVFSNGSGAGGADEFSVTPQANFIPSLAVFGIQIQTAQFQLLAPASQMFASDDLPLTPAFVSNATRAFVQIDTGDATRSLEFAPAQFHADSVPVPEPAAYILLIAGLAGMFSVLRPHRDSQLALARTHHRSCL